MYLRGTFLPPRILNPLGFLFIIPKGMPYYMARRMGGGGEVGVEKKVDACVIAPTHSARAHTHTHTLRHIGALPPSMRDAEPSH